MNILKRVGITVIWIVAGLAQVLSQSGDSGRSRPPEEKPLTFSVNVGLVLLPVTVLDKSGTWVTGLQAKDFTVHEDGVPQSLEVFDNKDMPVALGLMIDNSTSMAPMRAEVLAASLALAQSSNPEDEIFVAHFSHRVFFAIRLKEAFARNLNVLREAVANTPDSGRTALYDAVVAGLDHVKLSAMQKKVLVIVSDGADNASKHSLSETLDMAKVSTSLVYSIGIFDERNKGKRPEILEQLAEISGGRAFFPSRVSELPDTCRRIAADIRSQYTLGYIPTNQSKDGRFRKIRVEVRSPQQEKLTVRTRSGYALIK